MVGIEGRSPVISSIKWGTTVVEGAGSFKDAKIWPGGAREWDWRETGTHHVPGIQVSDVEELVTGGAEVVVLSRGMLRRLHTSAEVLDWLRTHDIEVRVEETKKAVAVYNRLAAHRPAGALIHSTC